VPCRVVDLTQDVVLGWFPLPLQGKDPDQTSQSRFLIFSGM